MMRWAKRPGGIDTDNFDSPFAHNKHTLSACCDPFQVTGFADHQWLDGEREADWGAIVFQQMIGSTELF